MKSLNKLIKAVDENKPLLTFLMCVFGAGWQMSVLYSDYLNHKKNAAMKSDLVSLDKRIAVLESAQKRAIGKNVSIMIADRDDRLKRCNKSLDLAGQAVNNIYAHHQRCLEREKQTKYASF